MKTQIAIDIDEQIKSAERSLREVKAENNNQFVLGYWVAYSSALVYCKGLLSTHGLVEHKHFKQGGIVSEASDKQAHVPSSELIVPEHIMRGHLKTIFESLTGFEGVYAYRMAVIDRLNDEIKDLTEKVKSLKENLKP